MNNIIFLDFDGVLNSIETLKRNNDNRLLYGYLTNFIPDLGHFNLLQYYDFEKIQLIKMIINYTNAKIVVISSVKKFDIYPFVLEYLLNLGLPIIDMTDNLESRGLEIKSYVNECNITNYIIIDDEISASYDNELLSHLVKTDYYNEGITYEIAMEAIDLLKKQSLVRKR